MKYVLIGGGVAGLIAAHILKSKNVPFQGIEKTNHLGGRAEVGPHRLLMQESVEFFKRQLPEIEWLQFEEAARERNKGEFVEIRSEYSRPENFYLSSRFFLPRCPFKNLVDKLAHGVRENFILNQAVEKILSEEKKVELSDGSQLEYDKLIWCADLALLLKAWVGKERPHLKGPKGASAVKGGLDLDLELTDKLFGTSGTVVFPFRYKEWKLRALGIPDFTEEGKETRLHWLLFLDKEIIEDREEVAKCVRTLKRELQKEFPELKDKLKKEKIIYLPMISGEVAAEVRSLMVFPDVFYLGPQAQVSTPELMNLDRIIANSSLLEKELAPDTSV